MTDDTWDMLSHFEQKKTNQKILSFQEFERQAILQNLQGLRKLYRLTLWSVIISASLTIVGFVLQYRVFQQQQEQQEQQDKLEERLLRLEKILE